MLFLKHTEHFMLTTETEEVVNLSSSINKFKEAIITGSCSLLLIIAMYAYLKLKKRIKAPCTQLEEKVEQHHDLYLDPSIDDAARNYKSLDLDGMFDSDLYENTRYSQSSTI